jgi:hypothetical protein
MASDAFFCSAIADAAAAVGVSCVIQPGGSIRDEEVIAADIASIAMIFTDYAPLPPLIHGADDESISYWQRRTRTRAGLEGRTVTAG